MEAADASATLEIARQQGALIDLVLTDVIVPGMSGAELGAHLRSSSNLGHLVYVRVCG